jgi:hypothetical protein
MSTVKIAVGADIGNVEKAIDKITAAINKMGAAVAAASKQKFEPVDAKYTERDLSRINKQFEQALKQSAALRNALKNSGQEGRSFAQIDWSKTAIDPKTAARIRDRAFRFATDGTAWDLTNFDAESPIPGARPGSAPGGGGRRPRSPAREPESPARKIGRVVGRAAGGFGSGVGGLGGKVLSEGAEGAMSGAAAGGLLGGLGGLAAGAGVALLVGGVVEAGKALSKGIDMAKQRDIQADTLKREMGDLGVSFEELKVISDKASTSIGMNAVEFSQLEQQQQSAAHGAYRSPRSLGEDTMLSGGFARSYGLDPSLAASFFGGMKNVDPRQNNKELALLIAEAIQRVGGRALASDVMQAALGFGSATARNSLSGMNMGDYLGAYTSMLAGHSAGVTSDEVSGVLSQANSAMMQGGQAGEGGRNFMLQALNRHGPMLNPVEAAALEAGGLFGTRNEIFGDGTPLGKYMLANGQADELKRQRGGNGERDVTNISAFMDKIRADQQDPWLRVDATQRFMGLSSPQQAAQLLSMSDKSLGDLGLALANAGVNMKDVNAAGLQTLAGIGGASSMTDLNKIYGQIKGRTGTDALSDDERRKLDAAQQGGDFDSFKRELLRVMAGKDQEDTEGNEVRKQTAAMENVQIAVGEKVVPVLNDIRGGILQMIGILPKATSLEDLRKQMGRAPSDLHGDGMFDDGTVTGMTQHRLAAASTGSAASDPATAKAMRYFVGKGWSKEQAAGIVANLWTESQMNPRAVGDRGQAYGITQWHKDRQDAFKQWSGKDIKDSSFEDQLGFVQYELTKGSERNAGDIIRNQKSASNAGAAASKYYERPFDVDEEMSRRASTATAISQNFSSQFNPSDSDIVQLPPEKTPDAKKGMKDRVEKSDAGDGKGAVDTVMLDVNINASVPTGNGGVAQHTISTSVPVPRGSGSQQVSVSN